MDNYGLWGVFIEITVIELANCYFMRNSVANPCPIVTCCYRKSKAVRRAVYVFLAQLSAAYLSYYFARSFWKLGLHPLHSELLEENECSTDLTVALTVGCLIEGLATFVGKAFEHYSSQYTDNEVYCSIANCVFSGFICALGILYTGMYANPIVAWACTFNCEGVSHIGHLVVYWLSPLIGWYLAEMVFGEEEQEVLDEPDGDKKKE
ncbi:hypothetical protein WR25_04491 [Diploscapter pachys]|uniref:Aquaporin n=1 Tax=Diploscapter pachys TaxID=2018661 RepID=A0A2A2LFX9_9BILA|nr:hypothetical protein WR25_04491 [Diploscapter pachys]